MIRPSARGGSLAGFSDFVAELRRRRVIRALLGWGIASFAVLQVYEPAMHGLHLPEWTLSFVVVALGLGFPVTVGLAWVFDLGPRGIERTPRAPSPEGAGPARPSRGRLALLLLGVGLCAAAPGLVYFFVWPGGVRREAGQPSPAPQSPPSVAVLPFADLSAQKDQEYLADGIAVGLLNALSRVEGLRVPGQTSSFFFRGKKEDLRLIGQSLGVGSVLKGGVGRSGDHLHVTAEVVDVANGHRLWSNVFDRNIADLFSVQDEIAASVVSALRVNVSPGMELARKDTPRTIPEAYGQYLLAMHFTQSELTSENFARSASAAKKAIALDPSFALAHVALSNALIGVLTTGHFETRAEVEKVQERAIAAANEAIALAPNLWNALAARSLIRSTITFDWPGAEEDAKRAFAIHPAGPLTLFVNGWVLASLGRIPESLTFFRKATETDPMNSMAWSWLGYLYLYSDNSALARGAFQRALEILPSDEGSALGLAESHLLAGEAAVALATSERIADKENRLVGVALAQHSLGRAKESEKALGQLTAESAHEAAYAIAEIHAWRGERDLAFEWLERSYDQRDPGLVNVKVDPLLRLVHDDPRFAALLRKMNLPAD